MQLSLLSPQQLNCFHQTKREIKCKPQPKNRWLQIIRSDATQQFSAQVDPSQIVVLGITGAAALYWWKILVPSERASLGRSKRLGPFKQYLVDIQGDESRKVERWFYRDWLNQLEQGKLGKINVNNETENTEMDQLNVSESEQAYEDKQPRFFSLDNPIIATATILAGIILISQLFQ
eukprot:TRINITY_DN14920_c0_g4_i1.p2 TRINITY_DN14920_c0_g4~~TRINITY_DN14920_c0_g4_i1.p2  ORF type:complete len:177 (-),score=9.53 TRINITY_DN14920_c0_g4_i1:356-886(-)